MKKKVLTVLLATTMTAGMLAGCGKSTPAENGGSDNAQNTENNADDKDSASDDKTEEKSEVSTDPATYNGKEVKVWVADNAVDFTTKQVDSFKTAYPQYAGVNFTVEPVGEGDAASNMLTDVQAGADVFTFAQDQIARLVTAGALEAVNPDYEADVKSANDEGAIKASTVGSTIYAYPITSDNGYFLYYDKSVVKDPSDIDKIVADCEAAGKNFYYEINSGWYQPSFFFGTGCTLTYDTDDQGNFTACNVDYASEKGVVALKEMIKLSKSKAFQNGSSADKATDAAAIVDGTWDAEAVKKMFGDNYACAKLPSFTGADGKTYQLSGFSGYKLLGVKPQEDADKLQICDDLAFYLSSEEVQLARYEAIKWGPSNLKAQESDAVKSNEALSALSEQLLLDIPQGQYPGDYWSLATGLGDDVITGKLTDKTSDEDLFKALQKFQDTCNSYVNK